VVVAPCLGQAKAGAGRGRVPVAGTDAGNGRQAAPRVAGGVPFDFLLLFVY